MDLGIVVIGSTDLTHYGPNYGFTAKGSGVQAVDWVRDKNDRGVIDAMIRMDPEAVIREGLSNDNACCCGAAAAAIDRGRITYGGNAQWALPAPRLRALPVWAPGRPRNWIYATSYDENIFPIARATAFVGYVGMVF